MSLTTVRAAIAKAAKRQSSEGCGPVRVRLGETRGIIAAAKSDGRVSGVERKEIKSFYESRVVPNPAADNRPHTMACPEGSRPAFTAPAEKNMSNFLYDTGGIQRTLAIPENP